MLMLMDGRVGRAGERDRKTHNLDRMDLSSYVGRKADVLQGTNRIMIVTDDAEDMRCKCKWGH